MRTEIEKTNTGYWDIFINDVFIETDILSTTIENCIKNLQLNFNDTINSLMEKHNQCPKCLHQCGYIRYYSTIDEFYCTNCDKKGK